VRTWFSIDPADRANHVGWVTPIFITGALYAAASLAHDYMFVSATEKLFPVDTRFEFRDAKTGQPIHADFVIDGPLSSDHRKDPFGPRLSQTFTSGHDGESIDYTRFTGFSGRPVGITFNAGGYQPFPYTITENSPREVTLRLQPK
jgi:hypothetical protein